MEKWLFTIGTLLVVNADEEELVVHLLEGHDFFWVGTDGVFTVRYRPLLRRAVVLNLSTNTNIIP